MPSTPCKLLNLPVYGITAEVDEQTMSKDAQNLALLLEEMGLYAQDGPVPAHVFHAERHQEEQ